MRVDYNLLRCFRAVAKAESISWASRELHLSQPAISLQIKNLENQLGKSLFDRHNRGLILTPFGQVLLRKLSMLEEFELEIEELVSGDEGEISGPVKVGTYTTASSYLLAEPVSEFLRESKKVTLSYSYDTSEGIIQKIKDYRLDCGIFSDVPSDNLLDRVPIFTDQLVLAQSKEHPICAKRIDPKDLAKIDFLSYPLRFDLCYRKVEQHFGSHLAKARVAAESESFDTLKQMLIHGAGATFIPKYLIQKELEEGILSEVSVGNTKIPIVFSLVTKKNAHLSQVTAALRNFLITRFKGY